MSDYTVDCSFVLFLVLSIFVGTSYSVMEFKLYFQGFKNVKKEFIVKDLTVVSIDGNLYELQLFQPPCQFQQLPTHLQKQVIWLEKQWHGLYWSSGFRSYKDLKRF